MGQSLLRLARQVLQLLPPQEGSIGNCWKEELRVTVICINKDNKARSGESVGAKTSGWRGSLSEEGIQPQLYPQSYSNDLCDRSEAEESYRAYGIKT